MEERISFMLMPENYSNTIKWRVILLRGGCLYKVLKGVYKTEEAAKKVGEKEQRRDMALFPGDTVPWKNEPLM